MALYPKGRSVCVVRNQSLTLEPELFGCVLEMLDKDINGVLKKTVSCLEKNSCRMIKKYLVAKL